MIQPRTHIDRATGAHVFVTGVTGFVGKVVLEELLRRQEELGIDRITVLIRSKRGQTPDSRFDAVAKSRCFARLSPGWRDIVDVVGGELSQPGCGMNRRDIAAVRRDISHVVHCAASVEFDLPVAEAAAANITSSMNMLELFRPAKALRHMTFVSTAYVTPHRMTGPGGIAPETLVDLPFDPETVYRDILDGRADERSLMALSGHPNTYTLTKCINELLVDRRRGDMPVSIVRPSIVSASLHHPTPGWLDSHAAFAGFVGLIGAGRLKVLRADKSCHLDIVPCDTVAERAIDTCFFVQPASASRPLPIRYAVAGSDNLCRIGMCTDGIEAFFKAHPIDKEPDLKWVGTTGGLPYRARALVHHEAPARVARAVLSVTGQFKLQKRVGKLTQKISYLNEAFPYFTHNTFRFESSEKFDDPAFEPEAYVELVCRGFYRNLVRKDEHRMEVAGARHSDGKPDAKWALDQPDGNWAIRGAAYTMRKALRKMTRRVTFDRPSFQAAQMMARDDTLFVIIPTHRSYMDFLVCSYLFFARSDLGIPIPHIAAAEEFSRIPVLGWLFQQTHAFYIKRGVGREDPDLSNKIQKLVERRQTLEFFIEGTRSRSRQFMRPRRGLLRAIQSTGQRAVILPVAITYDRVPEERTFLRELQGEGKPAMQLRKLLMWTGKMLTGAVDIGHVHVTCGDPLLLDEETDVHGLAVEIMAQLQMHTAATTHHLRCFLARNPIAGVDESMLRTAIEARGGVVLDSDLRGEHGVDPEIERTMRYHWMHLFYPEARKLLPDNPAIRHHCEVNGYAPAAHVDLAQVPASPAMVAVIDALFRPICEEYVAVARFLAETTLPLGELTCSRIVKERPALHLPNVEAAIEDLCERQVLQPLEGGGFAWGSKASELSAWATACAWPSSTPEAPLYRRGEALRQEEASNGESAAHGVDWVPRSPLARGATL